MIQNRPRTFKYLAKRAQLLAMLRERAAKGQRCPTRYDLDGLGYRHVMLLELARIGELRLEVGGRNWRVIEVNGNRTSAPDGWRPRYAITAAGRVPV